MNICQSHCRRGGKRFPGDSPQNRKNNKVRLKIFHHSRINPRKDVRSLYDYDEYDYWRMYVAIEDTEVTYYAPGEERIYITYGYPDLAATILRRTFIRYSLERL